MASEETPRPALWKALLRPRNVVAVAAVAFVFSLSLLKSSWLNQYGRELVQQAPSRNERVFNLFQTSFYFYYDDQFKPGIEDFLRRNPGLLRVLIIAGDGQIVFDSEDLPKGKTTARAADPQLAVRPPAPVLLSDPQGLGVLVPTGKHSVYYVFSTSQVTRRTLLVFLAGMTVLLGLWALSGAFRVSPMGRVAAFLRANFHVSSLRTKFIATILLVNVLTSAIVFFTLTHVQKKEQLNQLVKDSVVFSEFSTDNLITAFSNFFHFYYQDRFIPAVRNMIATNQNLTDLRIVSRKTGDVVFDSERMEAKPTPGTPPETRKVDLSGEADSVLRTRDTYHEILRPTGRSPYLRVLTTYRNDAGEAPFLVEYVFSFAGLTANLEALRRQILIDLIPSMALGILIAVVFSQLLVGPIKRLVSATQAITGGDYDVTVHSEKRDELGELMRSFNGMAQELKRKTELKKYLSEHSYRKITEASRGEGAIGGSRVRATVLFCDIRNFVSVCESMDAEEVTALLNEHFSNMVEVIYKHRGEVDKFIGDAILAVFYEPEEFKQTVNMALHAIYCAMEMREKLAEFNSKRAKKGKPAIEIGIGINSGEIISGPIGSPDRMDFTVIGDVVNLASRIEKVSKQGKYTRIVFTNFVEERVRGLLDYQELSRDKIRGKEEEIIAYELIKIKEVGELLGNLSHPDPAIKRHCIELLGYSSNLDVLPPLYQKLSDSNDAVRIGAVSSITRLAPREHDESLKVLFAQLERETAGRVISNIIVSIGRLTRGERLMRITPFLNHSDERIVANTIEALGATDDPKLVDLLIPFVSSKNNRIKANAAMVLFAKGRSEVIEALKPMLLHSDSLMRASAAFALGELTNLSTAEDLAQRLKASPKTARQFLGELQACVPLLVSLLKDADPSVKRQAVIALGKIKDKSAVLPLLDNLNLEMDSKDLVHDVAEALRSIGSHRLVREVVRQLT